MSDNYFAQLQMLSMSANDSVAEARLKLDRIAEIFQNRPEQKEWIQAFAWLRKDFPVDALIQAGAFAVNFYDTPSILPEELQHDSLGFVSDSHLVYRGRFVYPVKDTRGHVAGWCGYDAFEDPKYLDSKNYGYNAKDALFYGAEMLPTYYRNNRPVFVVEGIVCCLWLRSQGFQALASLGSYLTPYMVVVLKRFGRRCIVIPDSDEAGNKYRHQVQMALPRRDYMKRIIIVAAMLMMFFTVPAFATDGGMYNVKYMAANPQEVYNQIAAAEYPEGGGSISKPPAVLDKDMTAYVSKDEDTRTVTIHVVMPTFEPQAIPAIQADSQYNQSIQSLVDYVYQYRELKQTSSEYEEAMGAAPIFELNKYSLGSTYNQLGKTYTLTQMYMEQQITQTLVVNTVYNDTPRVDIDSNGRVHCSPETVQYSKDRSSWSTIKDGAAIPSSCYGESVYFRTPANAYAEASDYIRVYVREQQSAPTTKLELSSTSFSVTVDNASEFSSACEFSIDGTNYSSKTEWTNLDSKTNYTVYVRYEADSSYFASAPLSASITTKEGSKNEITYEKSSNAHTTYFVASGTTRINVSNKTMSATYTDSNVSRLKSDIKDAEKRMSAVTVLDVTMEQEEGDNRDFNKVKFSMPKDLGLLQLRLKTPYCTIIVSDSSTNLEIESISKSTKTTGLKDFVSGKDLVYKVTTKGDGSIEILYPWEFPDRADLSGLRVNYIDTKYKSSRTLPYQVVDNGIIFTMPDDGYFSITNLHRNYGALPFSDCQTHWAYSYIYYAYENGLINGISDTEFSPDTLVTRSQIAVLLARLAGVEPGTSYETPYTDVDPDSWYGWAVGYLYSRGVLKDQGDGLFGPDESITREQMAALVGKLFPYRGTIWRPMNCTDRDQISTYALNAVDGLYNRRVFEGDEKGNFNPNGTLTRGEFTAILYRLAVSVGAV